MKPRQYAGLAILLTVAIIFSAVNLWPDSGSGPNTNPDPPDQITATGIIGGKVAFFQDPDIVNFLKEKYGLTVEFKRVPSIEMINQCQSGLDYCWPSSQNAGETIKDQLGTAVLGSEIIFNSPLVMYTWAPIADTLIAQDIVEKSGDTYYIVDLPRLVNMIDDETAWADIGMSQLYGPVRILTTDPTQSNTGYSFAGLLANTLNGGKVVDENAARELAPQLDKFFDKLGLLQVTTTQLFEQFMTQGMGAYPIIAAYESNLIEYLLLHQTPDTQEQIRQNVRTLYPKPTVWTSQPMIALTPAGQRLVTALRDPEIQRLGWEHHGMRTAVPGVVNNVAALGVPGVPQTIDSVIPMPGPAAMDIIIQALSAPSAAATPVASRRDEYL
jgi:hypothetical protein